MKNMLSNIFFLIIVGIFTFSQSSVAQSSNPCNGGGLADGLFGNGGFFDKLDSTLGLIKKWFVEGITPGDPNQITGPDGYAEKKWMSVKDRLSYRIDYENDANIATASAQNVFLHFPVDKNININSFRLGSYGFNQYNFFVPENTTYYTTRLDLRDSLNLYVDVTAGIDIVKHEFFWTLRSIDPLTGKAPTDLRGFLPVSDTGKAKLYDSTNQGKGYATFSIVPESFLKTGDSIPATASIVFDFNDPVGTNIWVNYIDAVAPASKISSFDTSVNNITLHFTGTDDPGGTGVKYYDLYVSDSAKPFVLYKTNIDSSSFVFSGTPGDEYSFFTLATDNVGNKETLKTKGDITVRLSDIVLPVTWLYFNGQPQQNNVLLNWATTNELNAKEFIIERSFNGSDFSGIGTKPATGNSSSIHNYAYVDKNAMLLKTTMLYYRLQQVDQDGKAIYSHVVTIPVTQVIAKAEVTTYPNPFNQVFTMKIITVTPTDKTDHVSLYTMSGTIVYDKKLDYTGSTTILISDLPQLANGIYMLYVSIGGKMYTVKMVKQQ
ncbi:MAG TPA: T9SS type A sorting domain-containing protein [Parafilimonas sp.]|nr:T9SS type A sorting domain-containing protein [Parafilimonas sp.]